MATICAKWSSKMLSFCCLKAWLDLIFAGSCLKITLLGLKSCSKRFENASTKIVHVQLSGGHSDVLVQLYESMANHESIFKMFVRLLSAWEI